MFTDTSYAMFPSLHISQKASLDARCIVNPSSTKSSKPVFSRDTMAEIMLINTKMEILWCFEYEANQIGDF